MMALLSCEGKHLPSEENKTYVVKVNYIYSSILTLPSDTIYITSRVEPHIFIDDGLSILITDNPFNPEASNVRSFQILKVIE